jgi:hypothetical protein
VTMISENPNTLPSCLPSLYNNMIQTGRKDIFTGSAPYRDFMHFTGKKKPWVEEVGQNILKHEDINREPARKTAIHWVQTFVKAMTKLEVNLTFFDILKTNSTLTHRKAEPLTMLTTIQASIDPVRKTKGRFAYTFLMAGCSESANCRSYIYCILVASYILQDTGSEADIIVMVRMQVKSTISELPEQEASMLTKMGVQIRYLPLDSTDSFYSAMMAKFFILDYTEYDRIIFMDSDVIPLCNLDYLFRLSMEGHIRENVVLAWHHEPAAGGFFMLKPGGKDELDLIVSNNRKYIKDRPDVRFDPVVGWGHVIQPPDSWRELKGNKHTRWDFYGEVSERQFHAMFVPSVGFSLTHIDSTCR